MITINDPIKILVIDDDFEIIEFLKIILEPEHFEIVTTISGNNGVLLTEEKEPDLIILDILMPDINGLRVCAKVRKFSNVPILVLSAIGEPEMIAKALDAGADDYLVKPITKNLLLASVNKLTRRARAEQNTIQYQNKTTMH